MATSFTANAEAGPSSSSSFVRSRAASGPSRLRAYAGPLLLLSVITSLAFNRARLARQREEDHRKHLVQSRLLRQELARLTGPLRSRSLSTQEETAFAKRCLTAGLSPVRMGLPAESIAIAAATASTTGTDDGRIADVSWSEAFFGRGTLDRIKESLTRASDMLKGTFGTTGTNSATSSSPSSLEQKRIEEEWEAAFLAYAAAAEADSTTKTQERTSPPSPSLMPSHETPAVPLQSIHKSLAPAQDDPLTPTKQQHTDRSPPPSQARLERKMYI